MQWSQVFGHGIVKEYLRRSLESGKVAHAYAFVGPEGVGKGLVARIFLQALLCANLKDGSPCERCRDCRQAERGQHPDGHVIAPSEGSIGIEQVRELQRQLALKPYEADRKVALIEAADVMTPAAQNSLLKTLEEPAGQTVILLVASNPSALLPTVRSRCQIVRFQPLPAVEVVRFLKERGVDEARASLAAAVCGGSISRALAAVERDYLALRDRVGAWVESLSDRRSGVRSIILLGEELEKERERVDDYLNLFFIWLKDLLLLREGAACAVANQDVLARLKRQAERLSAEGIARAMQEVERARARLRANANFRLTVDVMLTNVQRSLS